MLFNAIKALIYGTGFVLFWWLIAVTVQRFDNKIGFSFPAWALAAGVILVTAGGMIAIICVATFVWKGNGTPAPFDPPREFVVTGPYKYVRNPMYLGAFLLIPGFALYRNSVSILGLWIFAIVLSHLFVVFFEEKRLEKRFGMSYLEYKKTVNRWIPKI